MNLKKQLIHWIAKRSTASLAEEHTRAFQIQNKLLLHFIRTAKSTEFGVDHQFDAIRTYSEFQSAVPVREYEDLKKYWPKVQSGMEDILWPGRPKYLCKTSGTTSGVKYIPISKQSIGNHIRSARSSLFHYIAQHPQTSIFDGKMLFLSGSPELDLNGPVPLGRLSGIVNHEIPSWFLGNKLPGDDINRIQPWELKIEKLVENIVAEDVRVFSGIPPWIQMFCERLLDYTGKTTVAEVFPNLELYLHGGVNFEPYKQNLIQLLGKDLSMLETYPASEGFIAFQDNADQNGMSLVLNDGIFYEFIEKSELAKPDPKRILLDQVQLDTDYAIILTTNAGLWAYQIGDLIRFVSLHPYRIKVSGRVSQFISAFGEHVIGSEIDLAIYHAQRQHKFEVVEFTVAPQVSPSDNKRPYHEWFIEFSDQPVNLQEIALTINSKLCELNIYYRDLIENKLLDNLRIRPIRRNGFLNYMRKVGRLGEQFKVHRLSNDRSVADALSADVI